MSKLAKALTAAAGNAGGDPLYAEDVFSTYLYKGASATNNIVNNIDVSGEGGLIWLKHRVLSGASATLNQHHQLYDTERGSTQVLSSNRTNAQDSTGSVMTFNSDGFTLNGSNSVSNNSSNYYASWTFRKAEKFFDIVTWTGNGVAGREIAHNLGSVPACIIAKCTSTGSTLWPVYHVGTDPTAPEDKFLRLNDTNGVDDYTYWNDTAPTDTHFTIGNHPDDINGSGKTYVAYLFASDAGGFGDDGDENIIKCGSYTGTGSAGLEVDLGFEPQWILIKGATSGAAYDWYLVDNMRGITTGGNDPLLWPNKSDAEDTASNIISVTATGFKLEGTGFGFNRSGEDYIYIAIRRPMKTPESGTEVYQTDTLGGTLPNPPAYYSGFAADWSLSKRTSASGDWFVGTRLTQGNYLKTNTTDAEVNEGTPGITAFDYSTGVRTGTTVNSGFRGYMFKRATGFFDVVAYTGTGSNTSINHNLGVAPELMIVKRRNSARVWAVWASGIDIDDYLTLNGSSGVATFSLWQSTQPTATQITLGTDASVNGSGDTYIGYLFATLAGVSKVGSYTGTGSNVDVDCGFSAGARFILIKRTDSTGDWYVWDSARGIVAGNDPYLLLNSTAAEVTSTDYIDPLNAGFTVTSSAPAALNASGGTYIFLAIA